MEQLFLLFIIPTWLVLSKNFDLNLNDSDSVITLSGSSLQNWDRLSDVFEWQSLYSIKLYISMTTSKFIGLSACVLFISLMQSGNSEESLKTASLLFLSESSPALTTIIVPPTSIYASLQSQKLDGSIEVLT